MNFREVIRVFFGVLSALGLVLSLAAHVAALLGIDVAAKVPAIWGLHLGIFVVFFPMIILGKMDQKNPDSSSRGFAAIPAWARVAGVGLLLYTGINFLIFMASAQGGSAEIRDGHYILASHGRFIREISAREYTQFQANVVRGFSGHWMFFYGICTGFFLLGKKRERTGVVT